MEMSAKKDTMEDKNINISSLSSYIQQHNTVIISLKLFYNKKLERLEVTQERTAKATPKIEKYVYYIFTEDICSACNPMQVVVFCKHALILQNNDSNVTLKDIDKIKTGTIIMCLNLPSCEVKNLLTFKKFCDSFCRYSFD